MDGIYKQTFLQRRYIDGQTVHEKTLIVTNYERMQFKTTMRYHPTLVRMAVIKKIYKQQILERILQCWWECTLV